jgi:hypothetical protein
LNKNKNNEIYHLAKEKKKTRACNFYRGFSEKKSPKLATFLQILLLLSSPYLDIVGPCKSPIHSRVSKKKRDGK